MRRIVSVWLPRWPTDRLYGHGARRPASRTAPQAPAGAPDKAPQDDAPLALVTEVQGAVRLSAVNSAAEAAGARVGQGLADARALLPGLKVADADPAADGEALEALADWCGRYTPWTAVQAPAWAGFSPPYIPDAGIFMDISGCGHLFGGEEALLGDLARRLGDFGIARRLTVADTPGAAWAVARFGGTESHTLVPPGGARAALAELPMAALRLEGETIEGLARVGFDRVGELYDLPRGPLARRFGVEVTRRLDQALGRVDEPISPRLPTVPYRVRLAFAEPVTLLEQVTAAAEKLLGDLCAWLAGDHRGVRRLELALYRVDGTVARVAVGTSRPQRAPGHLLGLMAGPLDKVDAGFGIEVMVLAAPATEPMAPAQIAANGQRAAAVEVEDLGLLIDRLGNRLGLENVGRYATRESHIPERAVVLLPADGGGEAWPLAARAGAGPHPPRPLRMLPAPEPLEVLSEVPDGPPFQFRWRRRRYQVARADGPERIAPEWWCLTSGGGGGGRCTRDYFRVEDGAGRRFWLYREGLYGPGRSSADSEPPRWYMHGVFA